MVPSYPAAGRGREGREGAAHGESLGMSLRSRLTRLKASWSDEAVRLSRVF